MKFDDIEKRAFIERLKKKIERLKLQIDSYSSSVNTSLSDLVLETLESVRKVIEEDDTEERGDDFRSCYTNPLPQSFDSSSAKDCKEVDSEMIEKTLAITGSLDFILLSVLDFQNNELSKYNLMIPEVLFDRLNQECNKYRQKISKYRDIVDGGQSRIAQEILEECKKCQ